MLRRLRDVSQYDKRKRPEPTEELQRTPTASVERRRLAQREQIRQPAAAALSATAQTRQSDFPFIHGPTNFFELTGHFIIWQDTHSDFYFVSNFANFRVG
jgi:hypothetical protein